MSNVQFGRKATLVIRRPEVKGNNPSAFVPESNLDLSQFHFTFSSQQQDVESPDNCSIRVYNLAADTVKGILLSEFNRVVLQAGYDGALGVIFDGDIIQYRIGRESGTTTYLDILAADGDSAYNFATINKTVAAGSKSTGRIGIAMDTLGLPRGNIPPPTGGVLPRGKVLFGMARAVMRQETRSIGATWNISNGVVNVVPLDGYLPGDAVVLNHLTGMVGIPEQTENGVRVRCLLNPRIVVGGLVKIDQASVNKIVKANPSSAPIAFNSYAGVQLLASITADGLYRVYVAEHRGDTRGTDWYTELICLSIDPSTNLVMPK